MNAENAPAISPVKLLLIAAATMLAASLFLPLWCTELEAPQYHGEDKVVVTVYPGRVTGNIREVQTLNQYIGVRLPLDAPELRMLPWALGGFLALTLGTVFLPSGLQKKAAIANFIIMAIGGMAGAASLQYRLYQLGHERTHSIMRGIQNFTPPILGSLRLANFHIETELQIGGWAFALAIVLTGVAIYLSYRESTQSPSISLLNRSPAV
ncbi:MAG TPA: hypothetical protein VIX12_01700 [Candidatus Binataceae bacterium]